VRVYFKTSATTAGWSSTYACEITQRSGLGGVDALFDHAPHFPVELVLLPDAVGGTQ
jgi:hypothetical protein